VECISGLVLRGERKPSQCPAFGTRCTPERPLGVTMVSGEGACAAYYRYRRTNGLVGSMHERRERFRDVLPGAGRGW
jgi:hydrogenase expression/formation protein HypD